MEATGKSKKCLQMMPLALRLCGCTHWYWPLGLSRHLLGILINIWKPGPRSQVRWTSKKKLTMSLASVYNDPDQSLHIWQLTNNWPLLKQFNGGMIHVNNWRRRATHFTWQKLFSLWAFTKYRNRDFFKSSRPSTSDAPVVVIDTYSYYEKTCYIQSYSSGRNEVWNTESIEKGIISLIGAFWQCTVSEIYGQ